MEPVELNLGAIFSKTEKVISDVNVLIVDVGSLAEEFKPAKGDPAPQKLVTSAAAASLAARCYEICDDLAELESAGVAEIETSAGKFGIKELIAIMQGLPALIDQAAAVIKKIEDLFGKKAEPSPKPAQ